MRILVPPALARKKEPRDEANDEGGDAGSGDSDGQCLGRVDGWPLKGCSHYWA